MENVRKLADVPVGRWFVDKTGNRFVRIKAVVFATDILKKFLSVCWPTGTPYHTDPNEEVTVVPTPTIWPADDLAAHSAAVVKELDAPAHRVKVFGPTAKSLRIVLPGVDNCRVKVTEFVAKGVFTANDIVYPCDETVFIVKGTMEITIAGEFHILNAGSVYVIPAGTTYSLHTDDSGCEALCVFSVGPDGKLPDDE